MAMKPARRLRPRLTLSGALILLMFECSTALSQERAAGPQDMAPFINNDKAPLAAARVAVSTMTSGAEVEKLSTPGEMPTLFMVFDSTGPESERARAELLVLGAVAMEYPGPSVRFRSIVYDHYKNVADDLFEAIRRWEQLNNLKVSAGLGGDLSKPVFVILKPANAGDPSGAPAWSFIEEAKANPGFSQVLIENWLEGFTGVSPARITAAELTAENAHDKLYGRVDDPTDAGLSVVLFYRDSGSGKPNGLRERMLFALEGELFDPKVLRTFEVNLDTQRGVYDALFHNKPETSLPDEPVILLINAKTQQAALYRAVNGKPPVGSLTQWDLETWLQAQRVGPPLAVFLSAESLQKKYSVAQR